MYVLHAQTFVVQRNRPGLSHAVYNCTYNSLVLICTPSDTVSQCQTGQAIRNMNSIFCFALFTLLSQGFTFYKI